MYVPKWLRTSPNGSDNLGYFNDSLGYGIFNGETLHRLDYNISQSKDPQKMIDKYYKKALSYYIEIGCSYKTAKEYASSIKTSLSNYDERREFVFELYGEFMNVAMNEG